MSQPTEKYKQFLVKEGHYVPTTSVGSVGSIAPGVYTIGVDDKYNLIFAPKEITTDNFIEMPSMPTAAVIAEIETFWSPETEKKFKQFGLIYKRGVLMHGVPGTGKTCTVFKAIKRVIELGGIAIYNPNPSWFSSAVKALRDIQGTCKIVCIFEEFDKYHHKADFLSLLDGELQVENVLYIATTNYIDDIPDNLKKRPSRFARVIEVGKPDYDARVAYVSGMSPTADPSTVKSWAEATEGFVLDQIKDVLISVECLGYSFNDAISVIKELGAKSIGIKSDEDDDTIAAALCSVPSLFR